jgi:3-oxoacyl-[acyl-carrier protein] reductase
VDAGVATGDPRPLDGRVAVVTGVRRRAVLMTSGQHISPMKKEIGYAVSKGALHQATLTLSEELIDRAITVNTVNPGPTGTGWGIGDMNPRAVDAAGASPTTPHV